MPGAQHQTGVQRTSFASSDEDEITSFIRQTYGENRSRFARVRDGARFSARTHDVAQIGADRVWTSIDGDGRSEEGFSDWVFFVVHAGSVTVRSRVGETVSRAGDVACYPLGTPVEFAMRGFDVTTVRLSSRRVARVAEELTGTPADLLVLHRTTPVSPEMTRYWRALTGLVAGALSDPDSPLGSPVLADDLARTVATAVLHTFPNSTMTRQHVPGPGAAAPATVRRAVAYLEENAHRPVQLSEVADAVGTSARALQYAFRRHLDTTPLAHLRRVRLERTRQDLREADPTRGDTVAAVAARWGFTNTGRFAAAYRAAYGVTPAETLRG